MSEPLNVYIPTVIDHFEAFRKRLKALEGELDDATKQEMLEILDKVYEENSVLISKDDYEKAKEDPLFFINLLEDLTKTYHRIAGELLKRNASR
jgi:PHD/YefM family antitoxin component YafN of YafNO toxin-antitoxin module